MDKMKQLYEKVAGDSALRAKFTEIMQDAESAGEEATKAKLTVFAKEAGYPVSIEEMQEFFKGLAKKEGQLSDVELDQVAGGKNMEAIGISISTIGFGCAFFSIYAEAVNPGGCGDCFR